jgi:peptide/nickel transport system substrate-binding protein
LLNAHLTLAPHAAAVHNKEERPLKMHRTRGRMRWAVAIAVASTLVVAACGGSSSSGGSSQSSTSTSLKNVDDLIGGTPKKGGTLTVGLDSESCSFVPSLCTVSFAGASVQLAVLDRLVVPSQSAQGWDVSLATAMTPNADFTVWTAKLPAGIKYSDDTLFTATDVKTVFDQYALVPTSTVKGNFTELQSVAAPDATTVTFTLKAADSQFPNVLSLLPMFKPGPSAKTDVPIGTGPFKITNWTPSVSVTLDRNPNYWGKDTDGTQLPYLDHLVFKPITSSDTRLSTLQAGGVSMALVDDPITLGQATKLNGIKTISSKSDSGSGWFLNTTKAPTDDVRVRKALAFATDKDQLVAAVGGGVIRNQYFDASSPFYAKDVADATPNFDQTKAKQLLDQYTNDPKRSDGAAVGTPVSVELNYVNGQIAQQSLVQVAQQQWTNVGVKVSLNSKDQPTMISDVIKGNFQATYFEWATPDPYGLFSHNYAPYPANPTNFTKFNSDQIQQDIAKMAVAKNADELKAAVVDASMVLAQNVPVIFIASTLVSWSAQPDKVANARVMHGTKLIDWSRLSVGGSN